VHWDKSGGAPSAEVVSAALSPLSDLCAIAKAGRVLSAANRTAVDSAVTALQEVCARDDASRGGSPEPDAGDAKGLCIVCGSQHANEGTLEIVRPAPRILEVV